MLSGVVNGFAVDVYGKVEKEGNFCYSPFALHGQLALMEAGAEKRTRDEMYGALKLLGDRGDAVIEHANLYSDMLERYTRELPKQIEEMESHSDVFLFNRIYLRKGISYDPLFIQVGRDVAGYGMEQKDFQNESALVRNAANAWVADETFQRVTDLLPEGAVKPDSKIVLMGGLFLQAPWHMPFDPKQTKAETYFLTDGGKASVQMMRREGKFGYLANSSWTAIGLPFGQYSELQLVLLVPKSVNGFAEVERTLEAKDLMDFRELPKRTVKLVMPPFELKGDTVDFKQPLMRLGVKRAFDEPKGSADFSMIDATRKTSMESVYQKSYLKIDELGCDVKQAVDAVLLERVIEQPTRGFEVRVDRPFMVFVQDTRTGMVLLMGRVMDPRK